MGKTRKSYKSILSIIIAFVFLLSVIISMWFTYGANPDNPHDFGYKNEYLYALIGLIFPLFLIGFTYKPVVARFKDLQEDVSKRWHKLRPITDKHKKTCISNTIRKFRLLYDTDFWITVLSTSKHKYLGFLGRFIIFIWSIGWFLYYVAIWGDFNHLHTISGTLLYSAMSSFDLFLIDINGNIIDNVNINYITGPLVALIGITSVCASLSLFSLVIGMFLTRLAIHLKGDEVEITSISNNHIYIFFGKNDKSLAISESIQEKDRQRGLVIFVECVELDDNDDDGWNNIVKVFSSHDRLRYDHIGYSNQIHLITHVSIEEANELCINGVASFWDALGLSEIKERLIALSKLMPIELEEDHDFQNEVHFFFMSDDRDKNVLHSKISDRTI